MVGGYCSTFRRGRYTFDAATHFYPLLGNPMTITGALLDKLGSRTRWVKMDPVDHFHFPDGSSFSVSADFDEYIDELKADLSARERRRSTASSLTVRDALSATGCCITSAAGDHDRFDALRAADAARRARPRIQGSQAAAAAVGRLRALGLAAVAHVVRVRLDAAAVVLPRQLLPGRRLAGVRRRSRAHRAGGTVATS